MPTRVNVQSAISSELIPLWTSSARLSLSFNISVGVTTYLEVLDKAELETGHELFMLGKIVCFEL